MDLFKKPFLMFLSLMFVFCLFACGPGEESEYSLSMRNASESGSFGGGTKLAVFDVSKDRYIEKYFGDENRASVPEEVGAVVRITSTASDCTFVLIDGRDGTELASRSFSSSDSFSVQSVTVWPARSSGAAFFRSSSSATPSGSSITIFILCLSDLISYVNYFAPTEAVPGGTGSR